MNHLVSIIMPTYNSSKFLKETIEGILQQSYKNWELLITDDNSNDNTIDIINHFLKYDNRIQAFFFNKNKGPAIARNNSIKYAKGRFIAFCDSDDIWKPKKLENQVRFMLNSQVGFAFSSYEMIDEKNKFKGIVPAKPRVNYKVMLKNNYIGCSTAIYDIKVTGKIYMPELRNRQDWGLWLKLLKITKDAYSLNEPLTSYRIRNSSISSNKVKMVKYNWLLYYKIENYSLGKSLYLLIRFIYYYLIKKIQQK